MDAQAGRVPSPTTNWYSGPVGCVRVLFVSISWPWPGAPGNPPAGYLGGGGSTLWSGAQAHVSQALARMPWHDVGVIGRWGGGQRAWETHNMAAAAEQYGARRVAINQRPSSRLSTAASAHWDHGYGAAEMAGAGRQRDIWAIRDGCAGEQQVQVRVREAPPERSKCGGELGVGVRAAWIYHEPGIQPSQRGVGFRWTTAAFARWRTRGPALPTTAMPCGRFIHAPGDDPWVGAAWQRRTPTNTVPAAMFSGEALP